MFKKAFNHILKKIVNAFFLNEDDIRKIYEVNSANSLQWIKLRDKNDLEPFTFSLQDFTAQKDKAASILNENGILIVKDFIPQINALKYASAAQSVIQESLSKIKDSNKDFEDSLIFIQNTANKLKTYQDLSRYPKTVMVKRKGSDSGMIDIFNYDISFKEETDGLREIIADEAILYVLSKATSQSLKPANLNLYYNKNVIETRPFHVDSYSGRQYKAFLYLTDVKSIADGPYCYVAKSHTNGDLIKVNKGISKIKSGVQTDAYMYEFQNVYPVLGTRGTLVISDQSGIHRGHPQEEGHERIVVVMNFTI